MSTNTINITVPAVVGPGGRAMLAGYGMALALLWKDAFSRRGCEQAYAKAAKADDLRGVLVSAPLFYEQMREASGPEMDAQPFPVAQLVNLAIPSLGAGADARTVISSFVSLMATHAGRGVERERDGARYPGDGYWTKLFGPDSDALLPEHGAAASVMVGDWSESYAQRRAGYVDASALAQELAMVRLTNMLAMIPRVAHDLWPELAAAVEDVTLHSERVETGPATDAGDTPVRRLQEPVERAFDDEWNEHVLSDAADRSADATPAAMIDDAAEGILRYEIETVDPEADDALVAAWKDWEHEGLYGGWSTAESALDWNQEAGPSPILTDVLKVIGANKVPDDLERKLLRAMDGGPIPRSVRGCRTIVERHRIARRWAWYNPEYRANRNDLVARGEKLVELPDGSTGEIWMRVKSEEAVEPELTGHGELASWTLSIVSRRDDGSHRTDPGCVVAVTSGRLLWAYQDEVAFEMCDMVDGDAVDFYKAIKDKLYPKLGVSSFEEWADASGGENTFLLIDDVWIRPNMRGQDLLSKMMWEARDIGFAAWWRVDTKGDHVHDLEDMDDYIGGEENNTATHAKAIVFQIHGTPRDFGDTSHAPIMRNISTGPRKMHVDPRIEARRQKLESVLFAACGTEDAVSYDPYEYPVT